MTIQEYNEFIRNNTSKIHRIANRLKSKNSDYSIEEITSMIYVELWSSNNPSMKGLYFGAMSRILEEKGLVYRGEELYSPLIRMEDSAIPQENYYDLINKSDFRFIVNDFLDNAGLNQDEVFVTALTYGLSTPSSLTGEYKKKLDNIEDIYYHRQLTNKEIASIMEKTVREMKEIQSSAFKKLKEYSEIT